MAVHLRHAGEAVERPKETAVDALGDEPTVAILDFEGWGMRIVFVPDNELFEKPHIEVRESEE